MSMSHAVRNGAGADGSTAAVHQFVRLDLAGAALSLVAMLVVNAIEFRNGLLWLVVAALGVLVVGLVAALRLVRAGRVLAAIGAVAAANWFVSIVVPFALPFMWPIMVLVVVIPMVLAAPHVPLRALVAMIIGGAVTAAVAAVVGLNRDDSGAIPDIADDLELAIIVAALCALMGPIALVVWQSHRIQRRALGEALRLNDELARSETHLRESRRRVVAAGDAARTRIERDLHDGAQQRLVALGMRMRALEAQLGSPGGDHGDHVANAVAGLVDEVDRTVDELRELAHGIYPPVLAARGLVEAFGSAARRATQTVRVEGRDFRGDRPGRAVEEALYFTGLEALSNAAKHAPDATVTVHLDMVDEGVELTITDDGPGLADGVTRDVSHGLANMRDRIEAAGGRLEITSAPGSGVTVHATIPISTC